MMDTPNYVKPTMQMIFLAPETEKLYRIERRRNDFLMESEKAGARTRP